MTDYLKIPKLGDVDNFNELNRDSKAIARQMIRMNLTLDRMTEQRIFSDDGEILADCMDDSGFTPHPTSVLNALTPIPMVVA